MLLAERWQLDLKYPTQTWYPLLNSGSLGYLYNGSELNANYKQMVSLRTQHAAVSTGHTVRYGELSTGIIRNKTWASEFWTKTT